MLHYYIIFLLVLKSSCHILPDAPTSDDELDATSESLSNYLYPDDRIDDEETDSLHSDELPEPPKDDELPEPPKDDELPEPPNDDELAEPPSDDERLDPLSIIMEDSVLCSWYVLHDETGTQINLQNFEAIIDKTDLPKTFKSYEASLDSAISSFPFLFGFHGTTEQEKKNFLAEAISPYLEAEDDDPHKMDSKELVLLFNIIMFNSKSMALPPCFIPANTSEQQRSFAEKTVSEAYSMSESEAFFLQRINQQALLVLAEEASETLNKSCHASIAYSCANCRQCRNQCAHTCNVCEDKVMAKFLSHISRQKLDHQDDDHISRKKDDNISRQDNDHISRQNDDHISRQKRHHHHHDDHHHHHDSHHHGTGFNVGWSPLGGFGVGWTPSPLWSSSMNNGHDLHIDFMPTPHGVQPVIHQNDIVIPLSNHGYNRGGGYNSIFGTGYNPGWNHGSRPGWDSVYSARAGANYGANAGWNYRSNPGWNYGYNPMPFHIGYRRKRRSIQQENYLKVYMQKYFQNLAKEDENMFKSSKRTIEECSDCVKCNIGCRDPCIKCQDWSCKQDTP